MSENSSGSKLRRSERKRTVKVATEDLNQTYYNWTTQELITMKDALLKHGTMDMDKIARSLPGRNLTQIDKLISGNRGRFKANYQRQISSNITTLDEWVSFMHEWLRFYGSNPDTHKHASNYNQVGFPYESSACLALLLAAHQEKKEAAEHGLSDEFGEVYVYLAMLASNNIPAKPNIRVAQVLIALITHFNQCVKNISNSGDIVSWINGLSARSHQETLAQPITAAESFQDLFNYYKDPNHNPLRVPLKLLENPLYSMIDHSTLSQFLQKDAFSYEPSNLLSNTP